MWLRKKGLASIKFSSKSGKHGGHHMVSHVCFLVELGSICNSMAASLCLKSCEDHSSLKSYNGGSGKSSTGLGPWPFH